VSWLMREVKAGKVTIEHRLYNLGHGRPQGGKTGIFPPGNWD